MSKRQTAYVCTDCGADFSKWQGQCSACKSWNTVTELVTSGGGGKTGRQLGFAGGQSEVRSLSGIDTAEMPRILVGISELDRVLGGGLVPGAAVLVGGHPGAGKSTLLLQALCLLASRLPALYVTGEESLQQVALRARRLGLAQADIKLVSETDVDRILRLFEELKPAVAVIDSIQVVYTQEVSSAPGSVSQVRESAAALVRYAKQAGIVLFLVGHVTKEGALAGPKVLEHIIDTSLMLENSSDSRFRTLRAIKNRFGAVNELGVFAMLASGLKAVTNPSAIFLNQADEPAPGSAVTVVWEGTRPLLVEIQALVDGAQGGQARRVAVGVDPNRLALLLAILHRHGSLQCADQDVFINIVGGIKVAETSIDLALLLAVVSSFRNRVLPADLVTFGEVGLSGEIRPVPSGQERIAEAAKHGFLRAIVPKGNVPRNLPAGMAVVGVTCLSEAIDAL